MSTDRYTSPLSERYSSKEMQYIFSQDMKFSTWRKLWIALAETEKELGLKDADGNPRITDEQIEEMKAHIYDINYDTLKKRGIKCLIFDLDNTLVPVTVKKPTKKVSDLFEDLKRKGFKLIIVSNSPKKRVAPFKDYLCTDSAYFSFKPLKRKYNKILKSYNYKKEEIACIGDQLLTDIWGANRMDFLSILVNPIGKTDFTLTKLNRFVETSIYDKLKKQDLLKKGRYYE